MAKLSDLSEWMIQTLRGDAARVRSLVQIARKGGMFATGGRGRGSPDMTSIDATNALILSLYDGPPTKCLSVIEEAKNLEPFAYEYAENGPREGHVRLIGRDLHYIWFPVPKALKGWPPDAWAGIEAVLSAPHRPYHLDALSYTVSDFGPEITLTVHDLTRDIDSELESETDHFQAKVFYRPVGFAPTRPTGGKLTTHTLTGDQFDRLYCLIHGIDPESDEGQPGALEEVEA